jgi:hypothetical protein
LTSRRRPVVKIIAYFLQHNEKYVVPTPLRGIRVGRRSIGDELDRRAPPITNAYHRVSVLGRGSTKILKILDQNS